MPPTSSRISSRTQRLVMRTLAFASTVLATGSVGADRYPPCPVPKAPQISRWAPQQIESFAPIGTWWFPTAVEPGDFDPRCAWSSDAGERVAARIESLPARPDLHGTVTWLQVSAESALDPRQRWQLACDWGFAECELFGSCPARPERDAWASGTIVGPNCEIDPCGAPPSTWSSNFVPIVPMTDSASISLQVTYVALESWDFARESHDVLRLGIEAPPDWFWARGGVLRVRYPDGRWTLAAPEPGGWPGQLAALPGPESGERGLDLELVDGESRVLAATRLELEDQLPRLFGHTCSGPPRGCWR